MTTETRGEIIAACARLAVLRAPVYNPPPARVKGSRGKIASMSVNEAPDAFKHASAHEVKRKKASELALAKKEDKEALIKFMQDKGLSETELGGFIIKLREKKSTSISLAKLKELHEMGSIDIVAYTNLKGYIEGVVKTDLSVHERKARSKKNNKKARSEPYETTRAAASNDDDDEEEESAHDNQSEDESSGSDE